MRKLLAQNAVDLGTIEGSGGYLPTQNADGPAQIAAIFSNILGFLTVAGGITFLIYFVIGGLSWVTAGGDTEKVSNARKKMTSAAIGMIAVVAAYAIAFIVGQVLGFQLLNPAEELQKIVPGGSN